MVESESEHYYYKCGTEKTTGEIHCLKSQSELGLSNPLKLVDWIALISLLVLSNLSGLERTSQNTKNLIFLLTRIFQNTHYNGYFGKFLGEALEIFIIPSMMKISSADYENIHILSLSKKFADVKYPGSGGIGIFGIFAAYTNAKTGETKVLTKELGTRFYTIINK